ncbi:MAG: non-canonical purine NTP pyrophosphatase [Candidatus Micrarchaeota archaeon]|nr:non-canonical purine NTP pyrophosphatase [Candidatus Micrarchaeota archaeon]
MIATSNNSKFRELRQLLGNGFMRADVSVDEIQSLDTARIAKDKARKAYAAVGEPVIAEDTGLYVKELGGYPGAMIKWVERMPYGYERLCRFVDTCRSRAAYAETTLAFYDGKRLRAFTGTLHGRIALHPAGKGFGWDVIFIPKGSELTLGQMGQEAKNRISMRKEACVKLKRYLASNEFI